MSDKIARYQNVLALLNDPSIPKHEQVLRAKDCLDSETITWLSFEDTDRGWAYLLQVVQEGIAAESKRLIDELDEADESLPKTTIYEIRQHRELMIPALIESIRAATRANLEDPDGPRRNAHFFALFLLGEFKAAEALPAIIEALSLPDPHDLFDDAITGGLDRILASLVGESYEILDRLILDSEIEQFVRWTAVRTYLIFVGSGRLSHDNVVERLRAFLRVANEKKDYELVVPVLDALSELSCAAAFPEIDEVFKNKLVDTSMMDYESVQSGAKQSQSEAVAKLASKPSEISDCIEELSQWITFSEEKLPRLAR